MKYALALAALAGTAGQVVNSAHAANVTYQFNTNTGVNGVWGSGTAQTGWNLSPVSSSTAELVFNINSSATTLNASDNTAFTFNTIDLTGASAGTINIAGTTGTSLVGVAGGSTINLNATLGTFNITTPTISLPGTLTFAGSATGATYNVASAITGSGSITDNASGTVIFSGAATYTGTTTINSGKLALASTATTGTAATTVNGGTLIVSAGTSGITRSNNLVLNGGTVLGARDNIGSATTGTSAVIGGNVVWTFDGGSSGSSATLTLGGTQTGVSELIVGGGGGGGQVSGLGGGGGGGGDVSQLTGQSLSTSTSITAGAGGARSTAGNGSAGTASAVGSNTAAAGLGGDGASNNTAGGNSGSGQSGGSVASESAGGGGGGNSAAGGTGGSNGNHTGGTGGAGSSDTVIFSLSGTFYGGGGGGHGTSSPENGAGGLGGGGTGDTSGGTANTGGGGGAEETGGSGIVVLQYAYNPAFAAGTVTLSGAINDQSASTLDAFASGGVLNLTGVMSTTGGVGGITIDSSTGAGGIVEYSNAMTYAGDTTITANGTLKMNASDAMTNGSGAGNLVDNGIFDLNGQASIGINGLNGSGTVINTNATGATLTLGNGNANGNFTGGINAGTEGSLAVAKTGTGFQILANNNSYTGNTLISTGTLQIGNAGTGGITGSGAIQNSGVLIFDTTDTSAAATYIQVVSGGGTLQQEDGTITLTGNETYTGSTTVNAGSTLQIGSGVAGGNITASGSIVDSGTLFFDSSTTYTYSNLMSGSGTLIFGGTDPLILGDNAMTGIVDIISTDTLQLGNGATSGSYTAVSGINNSGTLIFDSNSGTENYTYSMAIVGGGTVTQSGTDAITLAADDSYTGTTTISAGTLQIGNGATGGITGSGSIVDNSALVFDTTDTGANATYGHIMSGTGTLTQSGANTVTLATNESYTGTTTISAGVLQIGNAGTGGITGSASIVDNASLVFDTTDTGANATYGSIISGSGALTQSGSNTIILTADETYTGSTTISAGTLQIGNGAAGGITGSGSIVDNSALVFSTTDTGASATYGGIISGSGSLTQNGSNTIILAADEAYNGTTTISAGTLQIGNSSAGGITGSSSIVDNGALNFQTTDTGANATYSSAISGYGSVSLTSSTITLAGNNSYTGATTIDGASTLQVGNGAASGNITNSSGITDNGALIFDNTSATGQTYNNPISGSGSLAVNAGTVTLAYQAETLTGAVTVASGATLALANTNNGSPSGLYEVSSLTLGGTVVTDSDNALFGYNDPHTPALTINSGGVLTNLASADGGTGTSVQILSLITMNGGTLATNGSLTATNTAVTGLGQSEYGSWELYGGINVTANSTISAQQVVAVQSGGLQINIATGDTLNVSGSFITPLGLSDTGIILNPTAGKAGTLLFTGASTYTAATTIDAGTVQIGNGGSTGSITSTSNITNNGALVFNTSASSTYGMVISGSGSVTQSGTGTITLSNTETYTGTTTISSGTINLTGKLGDTAVTVNNGATLAAAATTSLGATSGTSLTLLSGSTLNLADGTVGNFTINNSAGSYSGTALSLQGATIDMDLGNSSVDQLVVANGNAVISGTNTINFSTTGDTSLTDGTYTILNVENGTKSASPVFEFANHSTKEAINVGGTYYTLSLVDPSGSEMLDIGSASQSIITLSAAGAGTPTGFTSGQQILNHGTPTTAYQGVFSTGTSALTVTGSNGNYAFKTATHINSQGTGNTNSNQGNTTAYIEINGFNPANDEEIAALGIDDNGSLLTATPDGASISTTSIASDINTYWDASGQSGTIAYVLAGSQYAGVFGTTQYNVYLDFTATQLANLGLSSSGDNYLAFDFTADPIFNGTSADLTVTAVAVVPEPSSLGLMGLGVIIAIGSRRRQRNNRKV